MGVLVLIFSHENLAIREEEGREIRRFWVFGFSLALQYGYFLAKIHGEWELYSKGKDGTLKNKNKKFTIEFS